MKLITLPREEFEKLYPNIEFYGKPDENNPQSMHYKYKYPEDENKVVYNRMMGNK